MKCSQEMTEVAGCGVTPCAFNKNKQCHALAINVGNTHDHRCDTMLRSIQHTLQTKTAGVGACKAADCVHNVNFECEADAVNVGIKFGQVECLTYDNKSNE